MEKEIISNLEEAIDTLKNKLTDYLQIKIDLDNPKKHFLCPFHNDKKKPNMILNPRTNYTTAHCFSCGITADIFNFANLFDNYPTNGSEWIKITIPEIGRELGLDIRIGELTEADKIRYQRMKLLTDVSNILETLETGNDYKKERGWSTDLPGAIVSLEFLLEKLYGLGWDKNYIENSYLLYWFRRDTNDSLIKISLFGEDKFTMPIKDLYGRVIGFNARRLDFDPAQHDDKYIHSLNSDVFDKSKTLLTVGHLNSHKEKSLYLFEGAGDLYAAITNGLMNCAATLGTNLSERQIFELKKAGFYKIILAFDNDDAGRNGIERFIDNVMPNIKEFSVSILEEFKEKDIDEYFHNNKLEDFLKLKETSIFEFKLKKLSNSLEPQELCEKLIPYISTEVSAIKRSLLVRQLSEFTKVHQAAIETDVESFRNIDSKKKRESIVAAGEEMLYALNSDPENAMSIISNFEHNIEKIEKRYNRSVLGVNYQLQRYKDLQTLRNLSTENQNAAMFEFKHFTNFMSALSGGMPLTRDCHIYVGGRANSGKTLSCLALGSDIALHDKNASVLIQTIDDSYGQVEPRLKTNLFNMYYKDDIHLILDMVANPWAYKHNEDVLRALKKADELFMDLLSDEKLIIIDSLDGPNLSTFERSIRYYRNRYPDRKFMCIQDNTHDLEDFPEMDQNKRMKEIASSQKRLTAKYSICVMATTEYRKAPPQSSKTMILPQNDDIADSRAMTYKPNIIFHVYNDLADRGEDNAELFWLKNGKKEPRLLWVFSKNKINSFKGRLVNDIDNSAVMLYPKDTSQLANEWEQHNSHQIPEANRKEMEELEENLGYEVETEWDE